ncbi:hypothetical protein ACGFNU_46235 [Spirillospora sp. NPDC048911]|uniref:hypothetical protein n=1 Tax=Spirillospora sp. NPDC048911 TaxID=3364527 RepID=UPI0037201BCD
MGNQIQVNPERIAKHGKDLQETVSTTLKGGLDKLNAGGTVEGGDFSITGTLASVAYPGALQFAFEDLKTHLEMLTDMAKKIDTTARNYAASEQSSKV